MTQSTKLFLILGFMFIIYTTMNGHLEQYLKIIFKGKTASPVNINSSSGGISPEKAAEALKIAGL